MAGLSDCRCNAETHPWYLSVEVPGMDTRQDNHRDQPYSSCYCLANDDFRTRAPIAVAHHADYHDPGGRRLRAQSSLGNDTHAGHAAGHMDFRDAAAGRAGLPVADQECDWRRDPGGEL